MKNKKNLIISLSLIIIIVLLVVVMLFANQDDRLRDEVNKINELTAATVLDEVKINKMLEERKIRGKYGEVEDAIKDYLTDVLPNNNGLSKIVNGEQMKNLLVVTNLEADRPNFQISRSFVNEAVSKIKDYQDKIVLDLANDKVMSYIENRDFDDDQKKLYIELVYGGATEDSVVEQFNEEVDSFLDSLYVAIELFDFLEENNDAWMVVEATATTEASVVFEDFNLVKEYNEIISKLN